MGRVLAHFIAMAVVMRFRHSLGGLVNRIMEKAIVALLQVATKISSMASAAAVVVGTTGIGTVIPLVTAHPSMVQVMSSTPVGVELALETFSKNERRETFCAPKKVKICDLV